MVAEANDAVSPSTAAVSSSTTAAAAAGLILSITDEMRSFLSTSSIDSHLSEDLKDLSSSLSIQSTAPYQSLWFGSKPDSRPDLSSLLTGSNFVFTSPTPRQKLWAGKLVSQWIF